MHTHTTPSFMKWWNKQGNAINNTFRSQGNYVQQFTTMTMVTNRWISLVTGAATKTYKKIWIHMYKNRIFLLKLWWLGSIRECEMQCTVSPHRLQWVWGVGIRFRPSVLERKFNSFAIGTSHTHTQADIDHWWRWLWTNWTNKSETKISHSIFSRWREEWLRN